MALLLWLLVRWWQITRLVNGAATSGRLTAISDAAQQFVGIRFKVQVKLTTNSMSPAVCGLFHPVILIPKSLAEHFSDEQLRSVLLHELIHLRRRDVWVNFVQGLLQIIYWWHPLVWLANARIRRVREEAVDDAVMLALRDEAESYAPTLLEVARLALNRPLVSLGLVGIIESRSALRQRIERLVDFRPPRCAGLTLVSLLGILAFTAIAVPMGDGPDAKERPSSPNQVIPPPPASIQKTNMETVLITASFYQMRAADFEKIVSTLKFNQGEAYHDSWWSASPDLFRQLTNNPELSGLKAIVRPRIQAFSGNPVNFYVGNGASGTEIHCEPFVLNELVYLAISGKVVEAPDGIAIITKAAFTNHFGVKATAENHGGIIIRAKNTNGNGESNLVAVIQVEIMTNTSSAHPKGRPIYPSWDTNHADTSQFSVTQGRSNIVEQLHRVRFENVYYDNQWLGFVTGGLENVIANHDPERKGIQLMQDQTQLPGEAQGQGAVHITIQPPLASVSLADLLDAIVKGADKPIKYSIEDYGVVFSRKEQMSPPLFNRHFKVNTTEFPIALRKKTGSQTNTVSVMAKSFFGTLGVDWESPKGKSVFYGDRLGELFVRGTATDLDKIENGLEQLNRVAPQIHIKARFLEVPKGTLAGLENVVSITNQIVQSNQVAGLVGILTDKNFRTVLRNLEVRPGVEVLAEPEVVMTSGRQAQMRVAKTITTVVTNFVFEENATNGVAWINPQTSQIETGPVLDVVPYVLSDGYTINLTAIPSLTKFLGYDAPAPTNTTTTYDRAGKKIDLPKSLPRFTVRQVVATLNLWDNQTAIISGLPERDYVNGNEVANKSKASDKELLVFITATIVDPSGNRVHTDKDLPFAKDGILSQPQSGR
jgi:type II secretory pathway component GspD/PulD (secretin)